MFMPNAQAMGMSYKYLVSLMLGMLTGGLILGCDDSPNSAARKQAHDSIEQSSRLVQQSQYESTDQSGMAQTDPQAFQAALNEWDKMFQNMALDDTDALNTASKRIAELSRQFAVPEQVMDSPNDRFQQIEQLLSQAISSATQAGARGAQAGPQILLGTMYLSRARDKSNQLSQLAAQIHSQQAIISTILSQLIQEQRVALTAENRRPDDRVNLLQEQLNHPTEGLRQQFTATEAKVEQILADRNTLQNQYQSAHKASVTLQRQYIDLLNQAENEQGAKRFELQQQAYQLQVGTGEGDSKVKGSIELAAEAQRLQNLLNVSESNLQYQLLWRGKLRENIDKLEESINNLQNSEVFSGIDSDLKRSNQRKNQLVTLLSTHLTEMKSLEEQYAARRQEVVDTFEAALREYDNASMSALSGNMSSSSQYAEGLRLIVSKELAQLWLNDASHNQLSKTILNSAAQIDELNDQAVEIKLVCEAAQATAEQNAAELEQEIAASEIAQEEAGFDPSAYPAEIQQPIVQEPTQPQTQAVTPPVSTDPNMIRANQGTAPFGQTPISTDPNNIR